MSEYRFAPSPSFGLSEHDFITWENGFSYEEIQQLIAYGDTQANQTATVGGGDLTGRIRRSQVAWLTNNQETAWLYDRLALITRKINGQFYNFDLWGFVEDFQYTIYHSEIEGHYDWHVDRGITNSDGSPRKLSLVLQLSDPYEYEGGDLEIMTSGIPYQVPKKRGLIAAFPSWVLHRVTPVTDGIRKTLVIWVAGPSFR